MSMHVAALFARIAQVTQEEIARESPPQAREPHERSLGVLTEDMQKLFTLGCIESARVLKIQAEMQAAGSEGPDEALIASFCEAACGVDLLKAAFRYELEKEFPLLVEKGIFCLRSGWEVVWWVPPTPQPDELTAFLQQMAQGAVHICEPEQADESLPKPTHSGPSTRQ